jgi:energy-coupling factor transporter transmembrane protein EcfT
MYKQFLTYVNGTSFLHKLDPRTKIITLMILSIIIFNTGRMWSLLSILLLFVIITAAARVPIKKLVLSVRPMLPFILIVFLLHFIFAPAPVFSDVTLSVNLMDNRMNNFDQQFLVTGEFDSVGQVYRLQYFEGFSVLSYAGSYPGFQGADEIDYLIFIKPPPVIYSEAGETNVYFAIGHFRIESIPIDQIPEERLRVYSAETNLNIFYPAAIVSITTESVVTDSAVTASVATASAGAAPGDIHSIQRAHLDYHAGYRIKVSPETGFSIYPSLYSFMTGLGVALKFILLIMFASLMAATTKRSALIQGIERMVRPIPLKWANITSHDLALMIFLTIRFIPLLTTTASQIKVSAASRAFRPAKHPLRTIKIVSTAMVNSIINFADDVSRAMLNRGYTGVGRTSMNELKFRKRDGFFFCSFAVAMFSIIMIVGWIQFTLWAMA